MGFFVRIVLTVFEKKNWRSSKAAVLGIREPGMVWNACRKNRSTHFDNFKKKMKNNHIWPFRGNFGATSGYDSKVLAIRFWCNCTYRNLVWCRMTVEKFVRIV